MMLSFSIINGLDEPLMALYFVEETFIGQTYTNASVKSNILKGGSQRVALNIVDLIPIYLNDQGFSYTPGFICMYIFF